MRQLEIAELMVGVENYTNGYVEALILDTPQRSINQTHRHQKAQRFFAGNIARMEEEMQMLERDFKAVEKGYGKMCCI